MRRRLDNKTEGDKKDENVDKIRRNADKLAKGRGDGKTMKLRK